MHRKSKGAFLTHLADTAHSTATAQCLQMFNFPKNDPCSAIQYKNFKIKSHQHAVCTEATAFTLSPIQYTVTNLTRLYSLLVI